MSKRKTLADRFEEIGPPDYSSFQSNNKDDDTFRLEPAVVRPKFNTSNDNNNLFNDNTNNNDNNNDNLEQTNQSLVYCFTHFILAQSQLSQIRIDLCK